MLVESYLSPMSFRSGPLHLVVLIFAAFPILVALITLETARYILRR